MNCSECKQHVHHLVDNGNDVLAGQLKSHIAACPDCYTEYEAMMDVAGLFKEGKQLSAPASLKTSLMNEITIVEAKKKTGKLATIKKIAMGVAAIFLLVIMIPFFAKNTSAAKATNLLEKAIHALESVSSMIMKMDIRTKGEENFQYIDKDEPLVTQVLTQDFKNKKWRIDKPGRSAFMRNDTTYIYIKKEKLAIFISGDAKGIMGWFKILLQPTSILREENVQAHQKGSKIEMKEAGDEIFLTVQSKASGTFINDIGRNSSIEESDNRREYVFDKKTNLLKAFKVYLIEKKSETLMLEMKDIQYNVAIESDAFNIQLPQGSQWEAFRMPEKNEKLGALEPEELAKLILTDLSKNDFQSHPEIWGIVPKSLLTLINEKYAGLEMISIGKAFQSGIYPGYFVPCKIKLKDGTIESKNLAIRNDNANKAWMLDGGF